MAKIDEFGHVENGMFAEDYIEKLEVENKRLREGLEAILKYCPHGYGDHALEYARVFAWEALKGGGE